MILSKCPLPFPTDLQPLNYTGNIWNGSSLSMISFPFNKPHGKADRRKMWGTGIHVVCQRGRKSSSTLLGSSSLRINLTCVRLTGEKQTKVIITGVHGRGASQVVLVVKNSPASPGDLREPSSIPGLGRSPGGGNGISPEFLPGESHGQRSLAGYSP